MDEIRALHTAARRYCRARHDESLEEYRKLVLRLDRERKGSWRTGEVTKDELELYPRSLVLWAILREVEQIEPESESTLDGLREALVRIGRDATDKFVSHFCEPPGISAIQDERMKFIEHVSSLSRRRLAAVRPLPFRRVLRPDERSHLCGETKKRWAIAGHWYPLASCGSPSDVIAFHTNYFDQKKIDVLRSILSERGVKRLWEFRWSVACEIELDSFYPSFEQAAGSNTLYGACEEGFWTNVRNDWLVYASPESSITLAGSWLVSEFELAMPDCVEYIFPSLG